MQLPSNKVAALFILIVLIVVLVIGGDVFFKKIKKVDGPEIVDADLILRRDTTDKSSADSDNDGLADWQEVFYGTDPNNSDTDGDGTADGEEIDNKRDPAIPGPNDELVNTRSIVKTEFDVPGYTPGSLTDNISKNLFSNYLSLRSSGQINTQSSEAVANSLVNEISQNTQIEVKYSNSDLNIVGSSDEDLTNYANEIAIVWIDYTRQLEALSDLSDDQYIAQSSLIYKAAADFMSKINVPNVAANIHLELVNNIYSFGASVGELAMYETDPIRTLIAANQNEKIFEDQVNLFTTLANYFEDNDIIYKNNEISRFWNLFE